MELDGEVRSSVPGCERYGNDSTNGDWNVERIMRIGNPSESSHDDSTRIGDKFHEKRKTKTRDPGGSLALKQIVWILRQLPSRMGAEVFIS